MNISRELYTQYTPSFNCDFYLLEKYKKIPSQFDFPLLKIDFFNWLKGTYQLVEVWRSDACDSKGVEYTSSICALIPKLKAIVRFMFDHRDSNVVSIYFWYTEQLLVRRLIEEGMRQIMPQPKENKISLIIRDAQGNLQTRKFDVKIGEIDVPLNYGNVFLEKYDLSVAHLNKDDETGIILFHGIPGTGKTSLIKYITKQLKKEVLFVPNGLAKYLTEPDFLPFLMNHSNSVLVIEDAEKVIMDRVGNVSSEGVSALLNLSDGILGDCLSVQIIATFNTERQNIDQALLRKGRLIVEHEFKELSVSDSNNLLSKLGKEHTTQKPMVLTDIYNLEQKTYRKSDGMTPIGFNRN